MSVSEQDREILVAYLDGELDEASARSVEARLNTDAALKSEADALKQAWEMLDYLPRIEATSDFTYRTMERLGAQELRATMIAPKQASRPHSQNWLSGFLWLCVLALAAGGGVLLATLFWSHADAGVEWLLDKERRLIENLALYENIDDLEYLRELQKTGLFSSAKKSFPRFKKIGLAELKKDANRYGRLVRQARIFLELPEERQEEIRALDDDVYSLPAFERNELLGVMEGYRTWLARLDADDIDEIRKAANLPKKVMRIKDLHEEKWIALLARSHRDELARLKGKDREEKIAQLKKDEKIWQARWQLATNHWQALAASKVVFPTSRAEIKRWKRQKDLFPFITQYLEPVLTAEESQKLLDAEGKWPRFPCTLVAVADRHPLALPGKVGPMTFAELPNGIKKKLKPTRPPAFRHLMEEEGMWPDFAIAVTIYAKQNRIRFRQPADSRQLYELWPTCYDELRVETRRFIDDELKPQLDDADKAALEKAEGRWPAYPRAIQRLADKCGLFVPWQTLPGSRSRWDVYRVKNYELIDEW